MLLWGCLQMSKQVSAECQVCGCHQHHIVGPTGSTPDRINEGTLLGSRSHDFVQSKPKSHWQTQLGILFPQPWEPTFLQRCFWFSGLSFISKIDRYKPLRGPEQVQHCPVICSPLLWASNQDESIFYLSKSYASRFPDFQNSLQGSLYVHQHQNDTQ